jgi:hypothetical protein
MEKYKNIFKQIILVIIVLLLFNLIYRIIFLRKDTFDNQIIRKNIAIATTTKNPHQLNDWIKYHLNIGFNKLYIVFDDENEIYDNIYENDNRVVILYNNDEWKNELSQLPNMDHFLNDKKEVMSRQILNFTNVRNYAKLDNIDWLLHIDADELFYNESTSLDIIFDNKYSVILFQNYEMIPKHDNYNNCFKEGVDFKINPRIYNAYSNGKSAVRVNSTAVIGGVHGFHGENNYASQVGKILHYPSCNFDEYINKYKILGKFEDKWWNSVQIPFKFHTESRDIITECAKRELLGETNACENSVRDYYNKSNVYNKNISSSDIQTIEFVKNQLLN